MTRDCPRCGQDLRLKPNTRQELQRLKAALRKMVYYDTADSCWKPAIREDANVNYIIGKLLPIPPILKR